MLTSGSFWKRSEILKPYVLKTRDGFLLGLAPDADRASPCPHCVFSWLKDRNVWVEKVSLNELTLRRDLIADLLTENTPHTLYEVSKDGTAIRMDCLVFPHPRCSCNKTRYIQKTQVTKNTNYAFSPLLKIFCTRFGTPEGNLWLTRASGATVFSEEMLTVYGVEKDKEVSRSRAIEEWMKKAVQSDLPYRIKRGELIATEVLQTGEYELLGSSPEPQTVMGAVGAGKNREEATLNALIELAKATTLKRYSQSMKNPLLVVGANQFIREKAPFFLLQEYDLHLLFYPNSTQAWVMGMVAVSRVRTEEKPTFVFSAHSDIQEALNQLFYRVLEVLKPEEEVAGKMTVKPPTHKLGSSKMNMWWIHWIYRCPKIALKEIQSLESYSRNLADWRAYYRDGQEPVSIWSVNTPHLPASIRTLVKVQSPLRDRVHQLRNVNGIGTWAHFQDALA